MEEQIEEEGKSVVVVDIAGRHDGAAGKTRIIAQIIDEGIDPFKGRRMIERDQSLLCLDALYLLRDRQSVVSGDRTD